MNILDNYLYTGGDDRKIKVWDMEKNCKYLKLIKCLKISKKDFFFFLKLYKWKNFKDMKMESLV